MLHFFEWVTDWLTMTKQQIDQRIKWLTNWGLHGLKDRWIEQLWYRSTNWPWTLKLMSEIWVFPWILTQHLGLGGGATPILRVSTDVRPLWVFFFLKFAPMMAAFWDIPAPIMGTFLEILPPLGLKNVHFLSKWPNFCPFMGGFYTNFAPMMGGFYANLHRWWVLFCVIPRGGHSRRGLHIHSTPWAFKGTIFIFCLITPTHPPPPGRPKLWILTSLISQLCSRVRGGTWPQVW